MYSRLQNKKQPTEKVFTDYKGRSRLRVTNIQLKMQETLIPVMSLENQTSQVRYG